MDWIVTIMLVILGAPGRFWGTTWPLDRPTPGERAGVSRPASVDPEVWEAQPAEPAEKDDGPRGAEAARKKYTVRLAVSIGESEVTISGRDFSMLDGELRDLVLSMKEGSVTIRASGKGLLVNKTRVASQGVILSGRGSLQIGRRALEEVVEVWRMKTGGLAVINRMPMDKYLEGVIIAEMGPGWPLEALKAQAVAARSYALRRCLGHANEAFDLASSTLEQVYSGIHRGNARTREAVRSTEGEMLSFRKAPIEALFHSCCGGRTSASQDVFTSRLPYLQQVDDPDCARCPGHRWRSRVSFSMLARKLHPAPVGWRGRVVAVLPVTPQRKRPALEITGEKGMRMVISEKKLKKILGYDLVPSATFTWETKGRALVFHGRGRGHGVGMCQWGARGMASHGRGYREILQRFYPGTEMWNMYGNATAEDHVSVRF